MRKRNKINKDTTPDIAITRVFLLTSPTALLLCVMVVMNYIDTLSAMAGYFLVLFITLALMERFMINLQSLVAFAKDISEGKDAASPNLTSGDTEASEIIKSINKIRTIWLEDGSNSQISLSDAAVLDTIPDPLLFINDNLSIIGYNLSADKLLGEALKEKNIFSVFPENGFDTKFNQIISGKEIEIQFEYTTGDKKQRHFIIKIVRLPAVATAGARIMLSINDVTIQKTIEKKQIEFFANASHELKTPLSVISGFVETIQTSAKDDPEATNRFLDIIKTQTDDMTFLINNLLSISSLESGVVNQNIVKVSLLPIIERIAQGLGIKTQAKQMTFNINIKKDTYIFADEKQTIQVLTNLMDNAVKYGLNNSEITVSAKEIINNGIEITVNNLTDSPIEQSDVANISERFFRTNEAKAKKIPGTGLGLSIVKAIANSYNGNMMISSDIKNGTTFTIIMYSKKH